MSAALLEEIRAEALARAFAGRKLEEVRLHPDAFRQLVAFTGAVVTGTRIADVMTLEYAWSMVVHIDDHGAVTVRSDATVPNDGHPRFALAVVPGSLPLDDIRRKARAALGKHRWRVYRCRHAGEAEACGIKAEPFVSDDADAIQRGVVCDTSYDECHHSMSLADAEHIAASDPAAVIALTDEVGRLEGQVTRLRSANELTSGLLTGAGSRIAELETALREAAGLVKGLVVSDTQFPRFEDDPDWQAADRWERLAAPSGSDMAAMIAPTDEIARLRAHVARLDVSDRALRAWLAELNQDAQRWLEESDDRANLRAAANRIRLLCEAPIATTTTARGQGMTEIEEQASRLRAAKEAMSALDRIAAQVEGKNADRLRAAWRAMTNEERLELIQSACRSCGSLDTSCRCGDDS